MKTIERAMALSCKSASLMLSKDYFQCLCPAQSPLVIQLSLSSLGSLILASLQEQPYGYHTCIIIFIWGIFQKVKYRILHNPWVALDQLLPLQVVRIVNLPDKTILNKADLIILPPQLSFISYTCHSILKSKRYGQTKIQFQINHQKPHLQNQCNPQPQLLHGYLSSSHLFCQTQMCK